MSSNTRAKASNANDTDNRSWYGVQDPRTRKRIQDRLAQRARRKRLAAAGKQCETLCKMSSATGTEPKRGRQPNKNQCDDSFSNHSLTAVDDVVRKEVVLAQSSCRVQSNSGDDVKRNGLVLINDCNDAKVQIIWSQIVGSKGGRSNNTTVRNLKSGMVGPPTDQLYLAAQKSDFVMALEICGTILGIIGCNVGFMRSPRQCSHIPDALQPTPLQLSTAHFVWIDRLPFPRLRDNLIILSSVIDLSEFLDDGLKMEPFFLERGWPPWDPRGWRMTPEFRAKWGYLFH